MNFIETVKAYQELIEQANALKSILSDTLRPLLKTHERMTRLGIDARDITEFQLYGSRIWIGYSYFNEDGVFDNDGAYFPIGIFGAAETMQAYIDNDKQRKGAIAAEKARQIAETQKSDDLKKLATLQAKYGHSA